MGPRGLRFLSLLLIASASVAIGTIDVSEESGSDGYNGGRTLSSTFSTSTFPYGACARNVQTPYFLQYTGSQALAGLRMRHCFVVERRNCDYQNNKWCKLLTDDFWKIEVEFNQNCVNNIPEFTFNGRTYRGRNQLLVTTHNPTGTARITQLHLNNNTVNGATFCYLAEGAGCVQMKDHCATGTVQCRAAIYNNPANQNANRACPVMLIGAPVVPPPPPCDVVLRCPTEVKCRGHKADVDCTVENGMVSGSSRFECKDGSVNVTATNTGKTCSVTQQVRIVKEPCSKCHPRVQLICDHEVYCDYQQTFHINEICSVMGPIGTRVDPPFIQCRPGLQSVHVTATFLDGSHEECKDKQVVSIHTKEPCHCYPPVKLECAAAVSCNLGELVDLAPYCKVMGPSDTFLDGTEVTCQKGNVTVYAIAGDENDKDCKDAEDIYLDVKEPDQCKPSVLLNCKDEVHCVKGEGLVITEDICVFSGPDGTSLEQTHFDCEDGVITVVAKFGEGKEDKCRSKEKLVVFAKEPCPKCTPRVDLICDDNVHCEENSLVYVDDVCKVTGPADLKLDKESFECKHGLVHITATAGDGHHQTCKDKEIIEVHPKRPSVCHPEVHLYCQNYIQCEEGETIYLPHYCVINGPSDTEIFPSEVPCNKGTIIVQATSGDGKDPSCQDSEEIRLDEDDRRCKPPVDLHCLQTFYCEEKDGSIPVNKLCLVTGPLNTMFEQTSFSCDTGSVHVVARSGDGSRIHCTDKETVHLIKKDPPSCNPRVKLSCDDWVHCEEKEVIPVERICEVRGGPPDTVLNRKMITCAAGSINVTATARGGKNPNCRDTEVINIKIKEPECVPHVTLKCAEKVTCEVGEEVHLHKYCSYCGPSNTYIDPHFITCDKSGPVTVTAIGEEGKLKGCKATETIHIDAMPKPCDLSLHCTPDLYCKEGTKITPDHICCLDGDYHDVVFTASSDICKPGAVITVTATKGDGKGRGCSVHDTTEVRDCCDN